MHSISNNINKENVSSRLQNSIRRGSDGTELPSDRAQRARSLQKVFLQFGDYVFAVSVFSQ